MVKALVAASIVWPLLLGAVVWQRATSGDAIWTTVVNIAASRICHQRPERSFRTAGAQWPVCGRCSGLYLAAPLGTLLAAAQLRRRRVHDRLVRPIALAAVPTAITMGLEWLSLAPVSTSARFLAALPLGAAIAFAIVHAAHGRPRAIG